MEKAAYDRQAEEIGALRNRLHAALADSKRKLEELAELEEAQANLEEALAHAMTWLPDHAIIEVKGLMEGQK